MNILVRKLSTMRLSRRLALGLAFPWCLAAIMVFASVLSTHSSEERIQSFAQRQRAIHQSHNTLVENVRNLDAAARALIAEPGIDAKKRSTQRIRDLFALNDATLASIESLELDSDTKRALSVLKQHRQIMWPLFEQLIREAVNGEEDAAARRLRNRIHEPMEDWHAAIRANQDAQAELQERSFAAQSSASNRSFIGWMAALGGGSLVLAAVLGTLLAGSVVRQLGGEPADAVEAFHQFSAGNLARPLRLREGDTDSVMASLEKMRQALSRIVVELSTARTDGAPNGQMDVQSLADGVAAQRAAAVLTHAVLHSASIGMATIEPVAPYRFIEANAALDRLLAFEPDQSRSENLLDWIHPEDRAEFERMVWALAGGAVGERREIRLTPRDRAVTWTEANLALVHLHQWEHRMLIVQLVDLSERHAADQAKAEFISVVSHELRTPLTSIIGALGLLKAMDQSGKSIPAEKVERLLATARNNGDRLLRLINGILDIDKITSGGLELHLESVSAIGCVQQALENNVDYAARFGVRFELQDDSAGALVRVDSFRTGQVLANLLSNASKFSPPGGTVTVSLKTVWQGTQPMVRVAVRDFGQGIAPEHQKRLFAKFYQTDSSATRKQGGTGLGLFISRQLVTALGGEIGFWSEPGQGSEFWFTLPAAEPIAAASEKPEDCPLVSKESQGAQHATT